MDILGLIVVHFGCLGAVWGCLGLSWGRRWFYARPGSIFGYLGAPSWSSLGLSEGGLGLSSAVLGQFWGYLELS